MGTIQFQLDLIVNLGEGIESEFVLYSIQDLEQVGELFDEMVTAWRIGDLDTIERMFIEDMRAFPDIYDLMLKDRNERWVPQIVEMLQTDTNEFVLVGAGHMGGAHGLLPLLQAEGFSVEQLAVDDEPHSGG